MSLNDLNQPDTLTYYIYFNLFKLLNGLKSKIRFLISHENS